MSRTRSYDNSGRVEAAAETRRRVIATARDLLVSEGYHAMSVAQLARTAGLSPQTVYNSVGGKAEVVKAVYDVMLAGDEDPTPMSERPEFLAMGEAPDRAAFGRAYAAWSASIYARVGSLLGVLLADGAGGDQGLRDFVSTIDRERRTGNGHAVDTLERRHGLAPGRDREELVDEIWTLTAAEVYDRLVRRCGWTHEAYAAWLGDALAAATAREVSGRKR
ncbi:TetR family transcriptional regulator [Intrasporangium oryzae NRRL B-24470]|uniref:TetR family transcriptional regulator n=1 Tax=Intrasporangium oryzae NRRL B-24470 TaxID=1386089 RepID=W9GG78_9MICO|nr:TetR/AcrR family transcriptional regulator [Intrasporangium oryzae]EWT02879.1 TetR family transcriptional regulator [Intrasporangium oryzae NRRL B-24470]